MKKKTKYLAVSVAIGALAVAGTTLTGGPIHQGNQVKPIGLNESVGSVTKSKGLVTSLALAEGFSNIHLRIGERSFHSNISFLETVLSYGKNTDTRNIFLLVNGYLTSNQQVHGLAYFERLIARYQSMMSDQVLSAHLSAYAILRATHADNVPLISRIGWMNETFDLLERASKLSNDESPIVHWAAGLIYAQVPFFFFKKKEAYDNLNWLVERPETEPTNGFYREAYHHLAKLYANDGEDELAEQFLQRSGYDDYVPKSLFMGWFNTQKIAGTAMSGESELEEIVPGKVFSLYGYGFSDVHFVVSEDKQHLIAMDAGTHPASLALAHKALKAHYPDLPPVTTAILTHAHWDHIGGINYLKSINPNLEIYGRENYHGTIERVLRKHSYEHFRGAFFKDEWVENYKPTAVVSSRQEIVVGGTLIELIPVKGGETEDALLINIPKEQTMFVGDILMPYYGEPWVEEGFVDDTVTTIDEVLKRNPKHVIHGHHPLTIIYGTEQLKVFRGSFVWLLDAVKKHISHGYSAKDIVRLNLIPPGVEEHPDTFLSYLAARDYLIARIADKMVGIWQEDKTGQEPSGMDNLTSVEYGRLLEVYLDLSAAEVSKALREMLDGGDNELALHLSTAAQKRYLDNAAIVSLREEAADKLRSAAQFLDPFKFVTYTEMIGKEHKPILTKEKNKDAR